MYACATSGKGIKKLKGGSYKSTFASCLRSVLFLFWCHCFCFCLDKINLSNHQTINPPPLPFPSLARLPRPLPPQPCVSCRTWGRIIDDPIHGEWKSMEYDYQQYDPILLINSPNPKLSSNWVYGLHILNLLFEKRRFTKAMRWCDACIFIHLLASSGYFQISELVVIVIYYEVTS